MAYGLKKISPIDLKPSTAVGVKIPFSSKSAFISVYTTKEQTKYNIINFLLTDKRERVFNPNFGAGLRSFIFEQMTQEALDTLEESIKSKVELNFPNVDVRNVRVTGNIDTQSLFVSIDYIITNSNENDSVTIRVQN
jgi:phage baseplate assembly protein W